MFISTLILVNLKKNNNNNDKLTGVDIIDDTVEVDVTDDTCPEDDDATAIGVATNVVLTLVGAPAEVTGKVICCADCC